MMFANAKHFYDTRSSHPCARLLCAALCAFLCIATAAIGQAQQPPLARQGSHSIAKPTPQQQAKAEEISRLNWDAAAALDADDYASAEADARQSLSLGIASGLSQELLAKALYAQGKTSEALAAYKVIADEGGEFPRNLLPYALLLLKKGDVSDAMAAYNKALRLVPDQNSPVMPKIDTDFKPDNVQPAALEAAIHVALGLTYGENADIGAQAHPNKALVEYQAALNLEPNWDVANFYYAYGLKKVKRFAEAKAAFQKAANIASSDEVKKNAKDAADEIILPSHK